MYLQGSRGSSGGASCGPLLDLDSTVLLRKGVNIYKLACFPAFLQSIGFLIIYVVAP